MQGSRLTVRTDGRRDPGPRPCVRPCPNATRPPPPPLAPLLTPWGVWGGTALHCAAPSDRQCGIAHSVEIWRHYDRRLGNVSLAVVCSCGLGPVKGRCGSDLYERSCVWGRAKGYGDVVAGMRER